MEKISVVIQTYNSERHLARVLESVKGFDEVLVVDMESTDDTLEIARRYGAKVIVMPRGNYNICEVYRQAAIRAAAHPWVLVLDSDELATDELRQYLYRQINADPTPRAIRIPCKNFFMGRWMRCYYPNYILRFLPRDLTEWAPVIHSQPTVDAPIQTIPKADTSLAIIHLDDPTMHQAIAKMNTYTDNEVARRSKRFRTAQLFYKPPYSFFKTYVLKGGFREGMPGFIHAIMDAYYTFVILVKIYEKRRRKDIR